MKRFKVIRKEVRYKHKTFHLGEFLPEGFTERDKYRTLYPSRIAEVEVPDPIDMTTPSVADQKKVIAASQKSTVVSKNPVMPKPNMSSLSGRK